MEQIPLIDGDTADDDRHADRQDVRVAMRTGRSRGERREINPFDLVEVVEQSVASIQVSAPGRHVDLRVGGPVNIIGDVRRMRQVVDNLLVNAIKHTPETAEVAVGVRLDGFPAAGRR